MTKWSGDDDIVDKLMGLAILAMAAPFYGGGVAIAISMVNANNWLIALAIVVGTYYLIKQALARD
jgi:hypothetical protein